ncbi:DUF6177 family protein [Curtobacterium sp. PhB136]|uniref:DUF6177 family protein n=1 Tax=Curtobacterium sp. PhB136 TaxID=2485181 RepID=UPI0010432DF6|nr:DUF6177 family protein [Curtobacterium sp. PhB136]TCK59657.1 hypothetical protein EDF27_3519 [Curtobacterium sp. PhB136]
MSRSRGHDPDAHLVAKHPLADSVGDGSVRIESRAAIVHLGVGRLDLLGRAAAEGARPILVTDGLSRLTEPFRQYLVDTGGAWVVRGQDGLRNGLDGRRLDAFTDAVVLGPPTSVDDVAVPYLRPEPADAEQLVVSVSVRHRAAAETILGSTAELVATELAGAAPTGWGTHEPAGRPWSRHDLTAAARDRMPTSTRFVVIGPGSASTVTAQRTDHGVEELTTGLVSAGPIGDPVTAMRIAAVPQVLGRLAATQLPLFALVMRRPGRSDLLQSPVLQAPPAPVAMLLGAPAVRDLGLDPAAMAERFGAVVAGRPRIPALVLPFGRRSDRDPVRELADVLDDIGFSRVADATEMDQTTRERVHRATEQ